MSERPAPTTVTPIGGHWYLVRDGARQWRVAVAGSPGARWVFAGGQAVAIEPGSTPGRRRAATGATEDGVMAPMPATVVTIVVKAGQRVTQGETLLVLEAMKMELPVRSPSDGVVTAVHCAPGDLVQPGVRLMEIG